MQPQQIPQPQMMPQNIQIPIANQPQPNQLYQVIQYESPNMLMSWQMWELLTWRNMLNIDDITKNQLKEKENKWKILKQIQKKYFEY